MAGQRIRRGCLGLFLLVLLALFASCGADTPAPAPPTPTPGAHFLMPTPAAPVSAPPYSPTPDMFPYKVREGDTLFDIALQYGVTVEDLVRINKLSDPNDLSVGQVLMIPYPQEPTAAPTP